MIHDMGALQLARIVFFLALTLLVSSCDDRDALFRGGVAIANTAVNYPIIASIAVSESSSELYLLNVENGSVRRIRPHDLNVESITPVMGTPGVFLLTGAETISDSTDTVVIEYSYFDDKETVLRKSQYFLRYAFKSDKNICAMRPASLSPKGQRMNFSVDCEIPHNIGSNIVAIDQVVASESRIIIFDWFEKKMIILERDDFMFLRNLVPLVDLEVDGLGFEGVLFHDDLYLYNMRKGSKLYLFDSGSFVEVDGDFKNRLETSVRRATDQVLYADDEVIVLSSWNRSDGSVTYSLVSAMGEIISEHVFRP